MKFIIDGVRYHVEECGAGFPLVALHGFTGTGKTWEPFCKYWEAHSRIIMPDLIGHGKTDASPEVEKYSIIQAAQAIAEMLDAKGVEQADVLGYSLGGRIAVAFGVLYPQRVRKLVLESTSPGLKLEKDQKMRKEQDGKLAEMLVTEGLEAFVDYWENIPLFQSQKKLPQAIRNNIRNERLSHSPLGLSNSLLGMGTGSQPSWWNEIKNFSFETLILSGSLDLKFCAISTEMTRKIPSCRHVTISPAGHAIHVEQAEKFGTIVSRFLSNT
ncbi:2-succinyl-6-hydroxy-2,4-cyclohexadiene-1-carboxylate synthase [Bacillus massilinigeriensis]|uniref:2-succinyl-6-hydroxy-2, 4-cyclohexadiene-1-carboxylate synthase n=1 Tax=Bacillus mediterraneensis TaxID=1805474 RepID=UPI0008F9120C|nr:2-succinyl-6-hydroxy-2,4-cyclohexadiene-1-carboxylate synthase [Bacillus mediterraneensis]